MKIKFTHIEFEDENPQVWAPLMQELLDRHLGPPAATNGVLPAPVQAETTAHPAEDCLEKCEGCGKSLQDGQWGWDGAGEVKLCHDCHKPVPRKSVRESILEKPTPRKPRRARKQAVARSKG